MNRRSFLQALGLGVVSAATVDVDKLLWMPGQKTYFLPSLEEFGPVSLDWITREALAMLSNQLVLGSLMPHYEVSMPCSLPSLQTLDRSERYGSIAFRLPSSITRRQAREEIAAPTARALAGFIDAHELNLFNRLPLPPSGIEAHSISDDKVALRSTCHYDIIDYEKVIRFDLRGRRA